MDRLSKLLKGTKLGHASQEKIAELPGSSGPSKQFTLPEVAKHATKKDLYIIIHDKVYDVTSFVDEHPGGEEVLLDVGGFDATEAFEDVGHSDEAREIFDGLLVGTVKREFKPESKLLRPLMTPIPPIPSTAAIHPTPPPRQSWEVPPNIPQVTTSLETIRQDPVAGLAYVLKTFDVPGHWSGKGQYVEFDRKEPITQLIEGKSLGRGASADVHEVTCSGVTLAKKQIFCSRRMKLEDVKRELDILKRINHKHVITLVGSYVQGKVLGLLLYPAAVCDLGVFLDELDEEHRSQGQGMGEGLSRILERLEIDQSLSSAYARLKGIYGCLSEAIRYLHDNNVRHKDLKPRNILLDRNDCLYVADFGMSRDITDASTSITDGMERGTYKYCAPEVARYEPRGRAADIYSLGCVFLEINTVYRRLSLIEFDDFRTKDGDHSFQNSPSKLQEWMSQLRAIKTYDDEEGRGIFDITDIIEKMVAEDSKLRPTVATICASLAILNKQAYYCACCREKGPLEAYQELLPKYKKLKGRYFEKSKQIANLECLLENRTNGNNASMAMPSSSTPITGLQSPPGPSALIHPTVNDSRRALDTLLNLFNAAPAGLVDQNEYMTVLKLTEKLRLQTSNGVREGFPLYSAQRQKRGQITYDFLAQKDHEVTVAGGDEVLIIDDTKSEDWWQVRNIRNGQEGVVPSICVGYVAHVAYDDWYREK